VNHATCLALLDALSKPEQILAVVGGAAIGALGVGLIAQLLSRWLTTKKLHPVATNVARGLGGAALGVLTAMWVWQGSGWGPNGPGGPGNAAQNGLTNSSPDKSAPAVAPDDERPPDVKGTETLRVEVLSDKAIDAKAAAEGRYYRILTEADVGGKYYSIEELKTAIRKGMEADPPLKYLDIVQTQSDSPASSAPRVAVLDRWASDRGIKVGYPSH
jgi:hypothetical protein